MRKFFVIWARELGACFLSPVAYVTMVVFLAVSGATFMYVVFRNSGIDEPLTSLLFVSIVIWIPVLITVISMRLFTEERRSGTIETLMTSPVTAWDVVMGKYAGALTFMILVCAPAIANIFILDLLSRGVSLVDIDLGALSGGCLILFLVSGFWVAIGLLMSLMTKNQIVAALCTFCLIWFALLFGFVLSALPVGLGNVGEYVSCLAHIDSFSRGSVDARPIVLYISSISIVLFASVRVLEMKRWR